MRQLRTLLDDLEPELLAWSEDPTETRRRQGLARANAAARELQAIMNALRLPARSRTKTGDKKAPTNK